MGDHASRLASALLTEAPGQLWDGKELVLDALGALCKAAPSTLAREPGHAQLVDAALAAAGRKKTVFRAAALRWLAAALNSFKADFFDKVGGLLVRIALLLRGGLLGY